MGHHNVHWRHFIARCCTLKNALTGPIPTSITHFMSTISSVLSNGLTPPDLQANKSALKADFKALAAALKSGNLQDAQTAYAAIQKDRPANASNNNSQDPMAAIGQALQSGNLAAAQNAFSSLQTKHGHHHHGTASGAASSSTNTPPSTSSTSAVSVSSSLLNTIGTEEMDPSSSPGSIINILA